MHNNLVDPHPEVIGKTFGKITVFEFEGFKDRKGKLHAVYITKCKCGQLRKSTFEQLKFKGSEPCIYCREREIKSKHKHDERAKRLKERLAKKQKEKDGAGSVKRQVTNLAKQYRAREAEREAERTTAEKEEKQAKAVEAAKQFKGDLVYVTQMLLNDREFNRTGRVAYEDGAPDAPTPLGWRPDGRAVVQATQTLASIHGLVTKRSEVTVVNAVEKMRDDELIDFIQQLGEKLKRYEEIEHRAAARVPLIEQSEPEIIGYGDED